MQDPKSPEDFTPEDFDTIPAMILKELGTRGGGLLDGSFELTDEWVANSMKEALWSVSAGGMAAGDLTVSPEIDDLSDEVLQEYAAFVFHATAKRDGGCHGAFVILGSDACENHALVVEDWMQRYEAQFDGNVYEHGLD
jgi:hypothetical protein